MSAGTSFEPGRVSAEPLLMGEASDWFQSSRSSVWQIGSTRARSNLLDRWHRTFKASKMSNSTHKRSPS
jgi:hypothetical protein